MHGILITACGLVALFTPLLLWLAWSPWAFWLMLATGCAALVLIHVLLWSSDEPF